MGNLVFLFRRSLSFEHAPHLQLRGILGVEGHVIYLRLGNTSTSPAHRFISHEGLIREFGEPSWIVLISST